jgi:hypothetical protein
MMELYDEGLDELMGAQEYAKRYHKAESSDEKMMYQNMSKQELEHANMIMKAGDKLFSGTDAADSLHMVWKNLREHLSNWKSKIEHILT